MAINISEWYTIFLSAAIRVFSGFSVYLLNVVAARELTISEYGSFTFILSFVAFLVLLCRFGLDKNLLREVARSRYLSTDKQLGDLSGLFIRSCLIVILISLLVIGLLWLLSGFVVRYFYSIADEADILLFGLAVLPWALLFLLADFLRGYGYINLGLLVGGISVPLLTILQVYLFEISTLSGFVGVYLLSTFVVLLVSLPLVCLEFRVNFSMASYNVKDFKSLVSSGYPFFSGLLFANLQLNLSLYILGLTFPPYDVALYSAGLKTGVLLGIFLLAINSVYEPRFAAYYSENAFDKLRKAARSSIFFLSVVAFFIGIPLLLYPEFFLLLFGEGYQGATTILMIVTISQIFNLVTGPAHALLIMTDGQVAARNISLCSLFITLITAVIFISEYGALGAALAHCSGIFVKNILGVILVKSRLNINLLTLVFKGG